ncbi:hypothetical protein PPEP_a4287 [Pseudoalteromonas peptidolytica F12-50-A1]|uniref:Uncharacterized protein n=1 Tax=Pseudoalteromonas peptidolytica F12-50-A1 TaxID=1315280 RepID=A0A8I0MZ01_9GAMM|nr:hypothetical protein [Pseudoalteromonas peptidolytica F12-50-A1]
MPQIALYLSNPPYQLCAGLFLVSAIIFLSHSPTFKFA